MIPKDLSDILENYDPEDFDIVITKVDYETTNPRFDIQFSVKGYNDFESFIRRWTIDTKQHRQSKISLDFASTFQISTDHPILWKFSDNQSELYFSGHCSDANKLFIDLYKINLSLFENLIPFEDTIHFANDFEFLMKSSSGLLAKGPNKLMVKYAEVLERYSLNFSLIGDRMPTYYDWDKELHIIETGNAKVLFIDNSFIVADDFIFT